MVLWLAFMGASIGSFLNVVAWRMPRGQTISGRSFCPRCQTRLQARDNFPVFGWLFLAGRCRTCRLPISARYPIVEALVGTSIAMVGVAELYRLALPFQERAPSWGPLSTPAFDGSMLLTGLYHIVALSVAWGYGLIRFDGHRLPYRLVGFGCIVTVLPMLAYPSLMCVPWQVFAPPVWRGAGLYLDAILRVLTGLAAAVFFARGLARVYCPLGDPKLDPLGSGTARLMDLVAIIALPAIVIGWQALPAVLLLATVAERVLARIERMGTDALGRFAVSLPLAFAIQIAFWRPLQALSFWPGVGSEPYLILAVSALVLVIPLRA